MGWLKPQDRYRVFYVLIRHTMVYPHSLTALQAQFLLNYDYNVIEWFLFQTGINAHYSSFLCLYNCRFGICPHMTPENRDQLRKRDLLTAFYDLDYLRNPKGSNYWRNR